MSKKGHRNHPDKHQPPKDDKPAEVKESQRLEMNKILEAITNMNLDSDSYIDVKPFDQGKQILLNAIEDLSFYIALFNKGDLSKFPAPTVVESKPAAEATK